MAAENKHPTRISRYYIDTRPLVPEKPKQPFSLPLIERLTVADQEAATRFLRPADRFMSLASSLLKYTFIHRQAKIPWSKVVISRTPVPHRRPYWEPPSDWETEPGQGGLEFNVTHQAGVVAIIGCSTPTAQLPVSSPLSPSLSNKMDHLDLTNHHHHHNHHPTPDLTHHPVRVGVDIACADEDKRTPKDMTTQAKFDEWVDIFGEMFSDRERRHMRHAPIHMPVAEREEGVWGMSSDESSSSEGGNSEAARLRRARENEATLMQLKLRRFYAYWALKEAYIKMVGEGLLASWLKELEFLNVVAPPPPPSLGGLSGLASRVSKSHSRSRSRGTSHHRTHSHSHHNHHHSLSATSTPTAVDQAADEAAKWTHPTKAETGMSTLLRGRELDDVQIELVAYDEDFLLATATRGVVEVFDEHGHAHENEDYNENGNGQESVRNGDAGAGVGVSVQQAVPISTSREQELKRNRSWAMLDIELDIRPCAEGRCRCLD